MHSPFEEEECVEHELQYALPELKTDAENALEAAAAKNLTGELSIHSPASIEFRKFRHPYMPRRLSPMHLDRNVLHAGKWVMDLLQNLVLWLPYSKYHIRRRVGFGRSSWKRCSKTSPKLTPNR